MAFQLMETNTFTAKCDILIPGKGKKRKLTFDADFNYIDQTRIDALLTGQLDDDEADKTLLDEVLAGWDEKKFIDNKGESVKYDDENHAMAVVTPFVRSGLLRGFFAEINGNSSRRKN